MLMDVQCVLTLVRFSLSTSQAVNFSFYVESSNYLPKTF